MYSQTDIDAVLNEAQQAVDQLATLSGRAPQGESACGTKPAIAPPAPQRPKPRLKLPPGAERFLQLRVPVIVRLAARRMPISEITQISPGSILEFDTPVDSELELLVNNKCIGTGVAVRVGEHFGLKVRFIGDARQRIASLNER
ncbi:MAG: FliM/FliN family flagellar motor switch protein [Phycisphaerae bacterium]|nr:FliM/FliN family flagellar motor switch protein [Phycisphaerae bacterium]